MHEEVKKILKTGTTDMSRYSKGGVLDQFVPRKK